MLRLLEGTNRSPQTSEQKENLSQIPVPLDCDRGKATAKSTALARDRALAEHVIMRRQVSALRI